MVKIAFYSPILCIRGTSVAIFDYAHYNEKLLNNKSIIITDSRRLLESDPLGIVHFARRFPIRTHSTIEELEQILEEEKCDILYVIKFGTNDGILSKKIKTVVHCVFDMTEPHGDVYSAVSLTLAKKFGQNLFVPHMISLKADFSTNWRAELGIPKNAIVFGRYGGTDTFSLKFSWDVIHEVLCQREDIWFLFINTHIILHPRVICLPKITENKDKSKFIATCDAAIEAGTMGHTFGLFLAEFSVHNKPLIVYKPDPLSLWNTAHLEIIGDKGIYFKDKAEFKNVLLTFNPSDYKDKDLNLYREYTPENVMDKFKKVFIDGTVFPTHVYPQHEKMLPISLDEYTNLMERCVPYFQKLKEIVVDLNELPEGNVLYKDKTFEIHTYNWPIHINLMTVAKKCNKILEVGFNMGHSALMMLIANPECSIDCIDICEHKYTEKCFEYLKSVFSNRIRLHKGSSHKCLREYSGPLVNMLHIDGCHDFNVANIDYFIGRDKVKRNGIIVFDDTWMAHLQYLWSGYVRDGHLQEIEILPCHIPGNSQGHRIGRLLHSKPKIALATIEIGDKYKEVVKYGHIGKTYYCRKHNYDFRDDEDCHDKTRPYAWSKVKIILKCLADNYEYVVWIDADTHIMNFDLKLEDFITRLSENRDILLASDVQMINSGVMFIKNTEWSRKFFQVLWNQTDFLNHPNWEQGAIIHMYNTNIIDTKNHITVLPPYMQTEFNSYYNLYYHNQFLIHLAGNAQDSGASIDDGRLKSMMDRFCPLRMDTDTEWDYICRMRYIGAMPPH